jgi:hypothetical protein
MLDQHAGNKLPHYKEHNMNNTTLKTFLCNVCESVNFILSSTLHYLYVTEVNICDIRVNCCSE